MVGATVSGVTVCCPECGGPLRVSFAEGGSIVGCHRCGEAVRVPARPHPVETPADAPSAVPLLAARQAARGVRLLQVSLGLFAVEHLLAAGVAVVLVAQSGPAGLLAPTLGWWLGLVLGVDLGLVFCRTAARWAGYRRCELAARAVGADGFLRWARWAPVVRLAGYLGVMLPWAIGLRPADLRTVAPLAALAWSVGGVLEFVAMVAWGKLLAGLGDRYAATRTARYAILVGVMVAAVAAGLMLVRVTAVVLSRRAGVGNPSPHWADLPAEAWPAVGGLAVVAGGLAAVAWAGYARILSVLRYRLREV